MKIKKLSSLVASQIAAGEVIERPASVLKELLENSIDAGSTMITVELEQGGLKLIRVRDNGSGIDKDDLALSLVQHATSKISTVQDLDAINSLGFRGEALASIAAVSQLELSSKPKKQEIGWELKVEQEVVQPSSQQDGTTVTVKNLFYNVPARRKFLRSERTEFNYLEEIFKRIALSQFNITFSLFHNGKKLKHLPACQNELAKTKRLAKLCGTKIVEGSIYINAEQNEFKLWGWLGLPEYARSQGGNQFFYINNRMIKDRLINHAIKQAYQSYCDFSKYPTYCLYFDLDAKALDVNVHPTKHEVRFRDARVVHAFLSKVIQEGLARREREQLTLSYDDTSEEVGGTRKNTEEGIGFKEPLKNTEETIGLSALLKIRNNNFAEVVTCKNAEQKDINFELFQQNNTTDNNFAHVSQKDSASFDVHLAHVVQGGSIGIDSVFTRGGQKDNANLEFANTVKDKIKILCVIGENKLILAQDAEQIILVDVKASQDKLLTYELEQLFIEHQYILSKPLLMPVAINFAKDVIEIMQYAPLFAVLGWQIDQVGIENILLRTIPAPFVKITVDYKLIINNLIKLFKEFNIKKPQELSGIANNLPLLNDIHVAKCIQCMMVYIQYTEHLDEQQALQLVIDITQLQLSTSSNFKREKLSFKRFSLAELQEVIYNY